MRRGSLLLVLSFFLLAESVSAFDSQCIRDKFVEYLGRSTHAIGVPYFDLGDRTIKTYTIVTRLRGPRGGQQILLKKKPHENWDAFFRGDVRTNFDVLGEKLAAFLGFQKISENEMLLPDAEEWNRGIEALNALIKDPKQKISTRFYTPKKDRVPDDEYWQEYIYRDRLPISYKGSETVHDVNTHSAGAFLPEVMRTHLKHHVLAVDEFKKFALRNYPKNDPKGLTRLKSVFKVLFAGSKKEGEYHEGFAQKIDFFTAMPSLSGMKMENLENALNRFMFPSLARNHSPETLLKEMFYWHDDSKIRKLLDQYIESKKSDPLFKKKYPYNDDQNKQMIIDRLNYIKGLVE